MPINKMFSIIIPAYNEASVITRTLHSILLDGSLTHTQIIVVCNACHDDTAPVVEKFIKQSKTQLENNCNELLIVETEIASKTNAINLGQSYASHSQRILLDADILVSGADLLTLYNEMSQQGALIASPRLVFNYTKSSFLVQNYYRVASISTYNRFLRISNVIVLSEEAIKRLGTLPQIIADDDYIRRQFLDTEKVIVDKCHFEFICPMNLASLLKALTRVRIGNLQLAKLNHKVKQKKQPLLFDKEELQQPAMLSLLIFAGIKLIVFCRAKWQISTGKIPIWERDESSRN